MAHIRKNCKNLSTTISLEEELFLQIDDFRFEKRKENRSQAIADLIKLGLKAQRIIDKKKRERMSV